MDQHYYLFLALFLPLLLLLVNKFRARKPGPRLPPGPWRLPVVGSLHHLLGHPLPHRVMRDLARRHGPLMFLRLGEVPTLVVSSPEAAKTVLKTHDVAFATRPRNVTINVLQQDGQGIVFAPYGDYWRQMRKVCILELLSAKRVQSFRHIREEEVSHMLRSIADSSSPLVNLTERLAVLITDSVLRAAIGSKFDKRDEFLRTLEEGIKITSGFSLGDLFPSSRLAILLGGTVRRAEKNHRRMFALMERVVQQHQERRASCERADADDDVEDLVDVLLRIQKEGGLQFPLSMGDIMTVIRDVLGAGSETSATTLQWAMAELMRNPRVMQKAQTEVRGSLKGSMKITEGDLVDLKYLKSVVKETLRLHPAAPLLVPRECQETCRVMGYDIPKGTNVLVNAWAIGRDPEYWDDPEEFKPERFIGNAIDFKGTDFEFIPFGSGRRICPGMLFAQASIELALASLLFHFDWGLPAGVNLSELDMTETMEITVRRKLDLYLRAILHVPLESI